MLIAYGVKARPRFDEYELATTQDHWAIDERGREETEDTQLLADPRRHHATARSRPRSLPKPKARTFRTSGRMARSGRNRCR